jgi:glycosyltransferase involved in cell wall biosynthesis
VGTTTLRILSITAGAANMYCGSCLRDNALARELIRRGHDVTLLPIYTPTRTDEPNVSEDRVLYGGVNVYLQEKVPLFRRTPAFLDRLLDSKLVMKLVSRLSVSTDPAELADLTLSTLRGDEGNQKKEVDRLVEWLESQAPPDVVILPNSLVIGLARPLGAAIGRPVLCTLQGEDLFLDGLPATHREQAVALIRERVAFVDGFVAVSDYYASYMGRLLAIPPAKMSVVPLGINLEGFEARRPDEGPLRIGYFARISPEKGLHNLVAAYRRLRRRKDLPETRLEVAGYLGRENRRYLDRLVADLDEDGLLPEFRYHGTLDRREKIDFLRSLAIVSVPTDYEEPKGMFLLEAMACGVPVVQPRRGAFAEILEKTGGGRLVPAGDDGALASALADLVLDEDARRELSERAFAGVRAAYTVEHMAKRTLEVVERFVRKEPATKPEPVVAGVVSH